jgi:hypothetical protein
MSQADVTRAEFVRLEDRVGAAEQEVEGEKLLSRYILAQSRQNGDDLAVLKARVDQVETELMALRGEFSSLRGEVSALKAEVYSFRKDLPGIVADALRDVLRTHRADWSAEAAVVRSERDWPRATAGC